MNILFDHQAFTIQRYGGISRYFYQLIKEMHRMNGVSARLPLSFSNNDYISLLPNQQAKKLLPHKEFRGKYQLMRTINNLGAVKAIRKNDFDLLHPTYYDRYFLSSLKPNKPFVLTVYDLIHEKYVDTYPELNKEKDTLKNRKELMQHARRVIAISHSTKQDLIDIYKVNADKVDVVHLASSFDVSTIPDRVPVSDYILFVGNRGLYKNFRFFLEVVSGFLIKYDLKLICAGGAAFSEEEVQLMQKLGVEKKVEHKKVYQDDELVGYYKNALLFVFPSLYEGFGIPILEALQLGCPAVVSNTSSFPEVGGEAVVYFDPTDKASLSTALDKVIVDSDLRQSMSQSGIARNKQFSWSRCASETVNTYREAI